MRSGPSRSACSRRTDAYLLALAVAHGGRLVSFDQRIEPQQVPGATASHLCVIAADGSDSCEEAAAPMAA
jgi:hypothetical protein